MLANESPSRNFMTRTPWVARDNVGISFKSVRMTWEAFGHDDDFDIVVSDDFGGHERAGLWRDIHGQDAGAAAVLDFVFGKLGLLAIAIRADDEQCRILGVF